MFSSLCFIFLAHICANPDFQAVKKGLTNSDVLQLISKNKQIERELLITGCSRSGTTFTSSILMKAGLDVSHEFLGERGCVSWFMCVTDKQPPISRPSNYGIKFKKILHQVRHPLKVIASVAYTESNIVYRFFERHIPEINHNDSRLIKAAKYWLYWNQKAEKLASWRYKIEDLETKWEEFCDQIGHQIDKSVYESVPKDTNHRPKIPTPTLTWYELSKELPEELFLDICEMAIKYGYSIQD